MWFFGGGDKTSLDSTPEHNVEAQTEATRADDTVWSFVRNADLDQLTTALQSDPSLITVRGPVGETMVHLAFLFGSPQHLSIGWSLIAQHPPLATAVYLGQPYDGENILHIAIVKKDVATVKALVQQFPELMDGNATGAFFSPTGTCPYGDSPLSFAVCTNQRRMVLVLVEAGADLSATDSTNGNTLLHLCVLHSLPAMYELVCKLWTRAHGHKTDMTPLASVKNNARLTPLTLAASLGNKDMLQHLVDRTREVQWTYGPVSCVVYPLEEIDNPLPDDSTDGGEDVEGEGSGRSPTALELILEHGHVELLMIPRVFALVDSKWRSFASAIFFRRLVVVLSYLLIFTASTIARSYSPSGVLYPFLYRPKTPLFGTDAGDGPVDVLAWMAFVGEALVLTGALVKGLGELSEMLSVGVRQHFSGSGAGFLENAISLAFCLCIFVVSLSTYFEVETLSRPTFGLAGVLGWLYLLWFLLGFRATGPFILIIGEIILTDVRRFFSILVVFMFGFSLGFFILLRDSGLEGLCERLKMAFMLLGGFEFGDVGTNHWASYRLAVVLLVVYMLVAGIMLINLFVAMLTDTYTRISENATRRWMMERARIVMSIENEMSTAERSTHKYWTMIGGHRFLQVEEVDAAYLVDEGADDDPDNWTATLTESAGPPSSVGHARSPSPVRLLAAVPDDDDDDDDDDDEEEGEEAKGHEGGDAVDESDDGAGVRRRGRPRRRTGRQRRMASVNYDEMGEQSEGEDPLMTRRTPLRRRRPVTRFNP